VFLREGHVGQDVGFGRIHEGRELWHRGPELVGDLAPLGPGGAGIVFGEGGADEGGHCDRHRDGTAYGCRLAINMSGGIMIKI
jgi:hypothetical protein